MRARMREMLFVAAAVLLVIGSWSAPALATPTVPAPEIDGGSIAAGIGLLSAGVAMLRARVRR